MLFPRGRDRRDGVPNRRRESENEDDVLARPLKLQPADWCSSAHGDGGGRSDPAGMGLKPMYNPSRKSATHVGGK